MPFYPDDLWKLDWPAMEQAFHANENLTKKYKDSWPEFRKSTINKLIKSAEKGTLDSASPNASAFKEMEGWIELVNKGPVESMFRKEY
tara:strand:+ start:43 stop:306 length:264 start_codon:yes stop_codon:yes gene_type:complete